MQTGKSVYKVIEDLLEGVELPRIALVEQSIDTLATLPDIGEGVREALRQIGLPGLASGGDLFHTSLQHLQGSL
jgi:hypothetical protein